MIESKKQTGTIAPHTHTHGLLLFFFVRWYINARSHRYINKTKGRRYNTAQIEQYRKKNDVDHHYLSFVFLWLSIITDKQKVDLHCMQYRSKEREALVCTSDENE
jgi:hypothetical protein